MKPIIISVTEEKDGYIRLKKEDLEKYIEDAYQTGLRDGRTSTIPIYPNGIRDGISTVSSEPLKRKNVNNIIESGN